MQIIAVASFLFAATALAAPQRGGRPWGPPDGNQEGPYQFTCSCLRNGQPDQWLSQNACDELGSQYPNLQYAGFGCVDLDQRGIEQNGMRRACQRQAGPYDQVDAQCSF